MTSSSYPPSPTRVDPQVLAPSAYFKKEVRRVVGAIVLFFMVYLLLILAAVALALACFYFGIMIIVNFLSVFTILIGLGMMAFGFSVVFFLIKFVFAVSQKDDNAFRIEISHTQQPELFSFIHRLSKETNTTFPKKIFLTNEVNARVFYNSSFWSMFFPVKKNLEIGLGLVNSISISEFKAVVAHEFGHFSQRSMKLGSFTYHVNRVIYNMLYNNSGYTKFLNSWGRVHSLLGLFASITVKIAEGIQWVLGRMYALINKSYLGLSRQMEFHADAVSASVSGGNNLITALTRIELAASCYDSALTNAGDWLKEKKATTNIFSNQLTILKSFANEFGLPLEGGLPAVSHQFLKSFTRSRINYKNQWASHPTLDERKKHLDELNVNVSPEETIAWHLFVNYESLQEQMTANLYKRTNTPDTLEKCDGQYFEKWYRAQRESAMLPSAYRGFYDGRFIDVKKWDFDLLKTSGTTRRFEELYTEENGQIHSVIINNEHDIETLKAIQNKQIDVKSFDFDGQKYDSSNCEMIIGKLKEEIQQQKKIQELLDKESFLFFYNNSAGLKDHVLNNYMHYAALYKEYEDFAEIANAIFNTINPFYNSRLKLDEVRQSVQILIQVHEKKLKDCFQQLLNKKVISEGPDKLSERMHAFNKSNFLYFAFDTFRDEELNELRDLMVKVASKLTERKFKWYKKMLIEQLELTV